MNGISHIFKSNRLKSKTPEEQCLQNSQCSNSFLNYMPQQLAHYPYPTNPHVHPPTQNAYHHHQHQVYHPAHHQVQPTMTMQPQATCLHQCQSLIQPNTYQAHNHLRNGTIDPRPVDQSMVISPNGHMNGPIPQATQQQFVPTMPTYPNNMMQSVPMATQPSRCSENNFYINHEATATYQQQQQQQQHVQKFQFDEQRQRQQQQQQQIQQVTQHQFDLQQQQQQRDKQSIQHQQKQQHQQQIQHQQQYQNHNDLVNGVGQSDEGLPLETLWLMHDEDYKELVEMAESLKTDLDQLANELEVITRETPKYSVTELQI